MNGRLIGMLDFVLLTFSNTDTSINECPLERAPKEKKKQFVILSIFKSKKHLVQNLPDLIDMGDWTILDDWVSPFDT